MIAKGSFTWKQTFPDTHSPLNEILIDTQNPFVFQSPSGLLNQVFRVFWTQDIHTSSLVDLQSVDAELIDRIAEAFPGVESLTLAALGLIWSLPSEFFRMMHYLRNDPTQTSTTLT